MEKYRFTSEKFTVTLKENGEEKSLPVFIALVCDGDGTPDLHGAPKVTRVEDCVKRYGEPMDYSIRLDILHPSFEKEEDKVETPVFMVAATQSLRFKNIHDGNRNYFGAFTFGGFIMHVRREDLTDASSKHLPVRLVACDLASEAGKRLRSLRTKACTNIA